MTIRRIAATALALALLVATPADAKPLKFAPGASATTVSGSAVRGESPKYEVGARAGQRMKVTISALEDNAAFQIMGPGGKYLKGAGEGDDAKAWSGKLPATGTYTIVVGGTRGNPTYKLTVGIN